MTTRTQATASRREITVGEKTYTLAPLTDKDYGEFEQWIQDRYIDSVKRNSADLTEKERERQLDRAFETAPFITSTSVKGLAIMKSIAGLSRLLWLSFRKEHPDITTEEVSKMLLDPEVADLAVRKLMPKTSAKKKKTGTKVQQRKKSRRRT
jgi:hypothetical protein